MKELEIRFRLLSRVNPVYPPRRRKLTAIRHAEAVQRVAAHVSSLSPTLAQRWAAECILDVRSAIVLPFGYPIDKFDGSGRCQARDEGGIEGQYLLRLARILLMEQDYADSAVLTAWKILYPQSAYGTDPETIVGEWELFHRREDLAGELKEDGVGMLSQGNLGVVDDDLNLYHCGSATDWSLDDAGSMDVIDPFGTIIGKTDYHPCETWLCRLGGRANRRDLVKHHHDYGMPLSHDSSWWCDPRGQQWFREHDGSASQRADEPLSPDVSHDTWLAFCATPES